VFNTFIRNGDYGELYLYDMSTKQETRLNPVNDTYCYRSATFKPDGTYILFIYRDLRVASENMPVLYYIPLDQINSTTSFTPIMLPTSFFSDPREIS